jgi:hypothetical protein
MVFANDFCSYMSHVYTWFVFKLLSLVIVMVFAHPAAPHSSPDVCSFPRADNDERGPETRP